MNANDMLDYALGQLDGPALGQMEQSLAGDPGATESVRRLSLAVHALLDDGQEFAPPPGLAARTRSFVAENARRRRTILDFVPVSVPFRWADLAVAAGILMAGLLTLAPAVQKSRERMEQAGCGYSLQQLGRALWQYGSRHHHYPFCPEENPKAPVGAFVALLHDGGWISQDEIDRLDCPCNGQEHRHRPLPDFDTVCRLHETDPKAAHDAIASDYAYNVGYRHALLGRVVPIAAVHEANVPLLADQPPQNADFRTRLTGNSPNHGGRGQNVLYSDLHIGWYNTRRLGPHDADMYLNQLKQIAPGINAADASLLPSMMRATGE